MKCTYSNAHILKRKKKFSRPTLWLSPLFLILLASLPVDRTSRDSSSTKQPGMVCSKHLNSSHLLWKPLSFSPQYSLLPPLVSEFVLQLVTALLLRYMDFQVLTRSQRLHNSFSSQQDLPLCRQRKSAGQTDTVEERKGKVQMR